MKVLFLRMLIALTVTAGCNNKPVKMEAMPADTPANMTAGAERTEFADNYPEVPDATTLLKAGDSGLAVYALCQQRYSDQLNLLKKETDAIGAKLMVTILSPETGAAVTPSTRKGVPFIMDVAKKAGIEAYDLTTPLEKYKPAEITQMPKDGHWSLDGSRIVAGLYLPVIAAGKGHTSRKIFAANERPATFGDLDPNQDVALDGGKGIPYQLITNSQGLRMRPAIGFPKTKQRILFLGDSQLFSPFLDNDQVFTNILQQQLPGTEIINAGVIGYTLDDYTGLFTEKAKYTEPDLVILVTNPNDIGDFYFSQRNHLGRSTKPYPPVRVELALYKQLYQAAQ